MAIKTTIGGNRLGSGKHMQTELNEYGRSTFNLSENFISTMAAGTLVPFYQNIGLNGDTFDFDLSAMIRTIPTSGPLFGSFKFQADLFVIPIRLYNGVLHNNRNDIGMMMEQVKMPTFRFSHNTNGDQDRNVDPNLRQVAKNALVRYLGISGIGAGTGEITGTYSALGVLGYMDTFKNYYANKQEKYAYQIVAGREDSKQNRITNGKIQENPEEWEMRKLSDYAYHFEGSTPDEYEQVITLDFNQETNSKNIRINGNIGGHTYINARLEDIDSENLTNFYFLREEEPNKGRALVMYFTKMIDINMTIESITVIEFVNDIKLEKFELSNIDDMRDAILKSTDVGYTFNIFDDYGDDLPYGTLLKQTPDKGKSFNSFEMNGLLVKTYQSDIFNAFMNAETGIGGSLISDITTIDVSDGLKIDALNLAKKVYNLLNRISAMGGTYDDWQEASYGETAMRRAESPIYCGGLSTEIVFEEITALADSVADGNLQKLGTLAGKGRSIDAKGGKVTIKVREPSIILGICSITPRLVYSQGVRWFNYKLNSMNDLHKPALDGIGFEDLNGYEMAWFARQKNGEQSYDVFYGKVPAWINYQTSVDRAFGDFIDENAAAYMVLDRRYEPNINSRGGITTAGIKDMTTYIDPKKFNTPFAYQGLESQNFWTQIGMHIEARRVMSAKVIPNL